MIRTLKILISLLLLFLLHRIQAWSFLSEQYEVRNSSLWRNVLTGILSDFWIAMILSLPFLVFEYFPQKPLRSAQKFSATIWIFAWGLITAAHQGYVEYFKFQIIPFHLPYLVDQSFVTSNGTSLFKGSSAIMLAIAAFLAYWSRRAKTYKKRRRVTILFITLIASAVIAHVLNIRWRVNWFVIEPLQANYLEALYTNMQKKPGGRPVSSEEYASFSKITGQSNILLTDSSDISSEASLIRKALRGLISQEKPVIIGVIIAESLRDIDTGRRSSDQSSITPAIDLLQERGVRFTNVYSSGPVTRGGQEASWCGTPSATDTSLMRSFPDANVKCLPARARARKDIQALWLHGGDERFDSQLAFWTHQGVSRFITKSDFPSETPSTGWGVSDLALFDRSALLLEDVSKTKDVKIILPMILTVSNHIPWVVPDDASLDTKNFIASHPSHRTIKYFDESLDLFVGTLKDRNLWQNSIFVIMGDHGNLETPWRNTYGDDPLKWERMMSHVSVTLTGGIIERLRMDGQLPATISRFTAQNQIAPFLAEISDLSDDSPFMDQSLFNQSPWPVASDLNQYLFLPEAGLKLDKERVLEGTTPPSAGAAWLAATRYRAWIEFLYTGEKGKTAK